MLGATATITATAMTRLLARPSLQGPYTPPPLPQHLDPNYVFSQLVPLIGVVVVMVCGALGLRWLFRSPVGEAVAERIRQGRRGRQAVALEASANARALEERVAHLESLVSELSERVDFAERLLAKQRSVERLAPPG